MRFFGNKPCRMDGCNRAAVVGNKYCTVHRSKAARVRDSMPGARQKTKGTKPSTYIVVGLWKRIRNLFSSESRSKKSKPKRGNLIQRVHLFCELPVDMPWMDKASVSSSRPGGDFIAYADNALGLRGELVEYIHKTGLPDKKNI